MATVQNKRKVSVKRLKGLLYDPKRKPVTIEEMHEGIKRAVLKGDVPDALLRKSH